MYIVHVCVGGRSRVRVVCMYMHVSACVHVCMCVHSCIRACVFVYVCLCMCGHVSVKEVKGHLFPATSTSATFLVSPGSKRIAVPDAMFYNQNCC